MDGSRIGDQLNRVTSLLRGAASALRSNSPVILTSMAVAGVVGTTILAVKATSQAKDAIYLEEDDRGEQNGRSSRYLTAKEQVQLVWMHYIPAASVGLVTIACIITAQSINSRRQAAVMSLYTITDTAFREYQEKNIEVNGTTKHQKVKDELAKDAIAANPPDKTLIIGPGEIGVYDKYSGRYFTSSVQDIKAAQNDVNASIINGDMYASLNDFYMRIGLHVTKVGEEMGFTLDNLIDLDFSSVLHEDVPYLAIDFRAMPVPEYHRFR